MKKFIVALVAAALSAALATPLLAQDTRPRGMLQERVPKPSIEGNYWSRSFGPNSAGFRITKVESTGEVKGFIGGEVRNCRPEWNNCRLGLWRYHFGTHANATFRDGQLQIRTENGSFYQLQLGGRSFVGTYKSGGENVQVTFTRS